MTAPSERVRLGRKPERGSHDPEVLQAILRAGLVCHLGIVVDGQPYVIPTLYGVAGDTVYVHASSGSRTARVAAAGAPVCLTVTLIDALVLARSGFHHSANYRSVVVLGTCREVVDEAEKVRGLEVITDHLVPSRWATLRPPTAKELAATTVLALPLAEASAKIRDAGVGDEPEDVDPAVWAGLIPLQTVGGPPQPDDVTAVPPPPHVAGWVPPSARTVGP